MRAGAIIKYIKTIYPCHTKVFYQALQLISCLNNFCFYLVHYYMICAWHCEISRYPELCSVHTIFTFYFIFHSAKMLTCNLQRRNGELICDCTFADKLDFFFSTNWHFIYDRLWKS